MEWVISDTHFGHSNIIKYCARPFKNVEHMNEMMIARWQHRVKASDIVYHLGDVGLTKGDFLEKIIARLPGRKVLVLGNHDKSAKRMTEMGFEFACSSMIVKPDGFNGAVMLNHYPLKTMPIVEKSTYNTPMLVMHGHIHNSLPEHRAAHVAKGELVNIPPFNINCSVEMINYEPVPLVWMIKKHIKETQ